MVNRSLILALALAGALGAWQSKPQPSKPQEAKPQEAPPQTQEPAEEDESLKPKEYSFNPLQATKELTVGLYYFKKKNYRAATQRFTEATHWNPNFPEAYLRLAEAEEKLKDKPAARQAYAKYLELQPDAKDADEVRKKLSSQR